MKDVVVAAYPDATAAHLGRVRLEAAGLEAWIGNENFSSVYPLFGAITGGVELRVHEKDAARAGEVLYGADDGAQAGSTRCPQCASEHVGENTIGFTRLMLLTLLTCGMYLPMFYRKHRCGDCGCRW